MSTGRRAFARPTAAETLAAILNEDPPGIRRGKPLLPAGLRRIAAHCLEKDPADRFQSARDLAYDLKCLAGGSRAVSRSRGARRPVIRSLAILPFENAGGDPESEYLA